MLKRFILSLVLLAASVTTTLAAYPYDSVAEILVNVGGQHAGGSATLIAVTNDQALLLTCQHVARRPGQAVQVHWAATGEESEGRVTRVAKNRLDAALVICPRPGKLRPVPVSSFDPCEDAQIINIGYPGIEGSLEWQIGTVTDLNTTDLRYTCRPIPGMSGGATLDVYGNLVGVIQYYNAVGGGSTSGRKLLEFLRDYILETKTIWEADMPEKEVELDLPDDLMQIKAPDSYRDFLIYLYTRYEDGPVAYFLEGTTEDESEPFAVLPKHPTNLRVDLHKNNLHISYKRTPRRMYQRTWRFSPRRRGVYRNCY